MLCLHPAVKLLIFSELLASGTTWCWAWAALGGCSDVSLVQTTASLEWHYDVHYGWPIVIRIVLALR